MSPPLKSFEGPDVEVLLERIRREVGPHAKISGAEKIRVGGVLGFFAKEQYRVLVESVEVSGVLRPVETNSRNRQPAHAKPGRRARRRGAGRDVTAPSHAVVLRDGEPTAQVPAVARPRTRADAGPVAGDEVWEGAAETFGADMFTVLADATDDVNDVAGAPTAVVPAQVPVVPAAEEERPEDFDAVLCRIATTLDAPLPAPPAPPASSSGVAPSGGAKAADPGTTYAGTAILEPRPGTARIGGSSSGAGRSGADEPGPGGRGGGAGPFYGGESASRSLASEAALFLAGTAAAGPSLDAVELLRPAGMGDDVLRAVAEALDAGADLEAILLEVFNRLPAAPPVPRRAGSLLVVVGAGPQVRALAGEVAIEVGADPGAVPFASLDPGVAAGDERLLVRSAEEAGELAPGWRRSQVAVVAVDAPLTGGQRPWARHVLAALRPTAVWGVVDATSKAEDVRAWAADLGGVDAVALHNLDATVSPTAALGAGIPVVRLDGRPASAARWTATVADRVGRCT